MTSQHQHLMAGAVVTQREAGSRGPRGALALHPPKASRHHAERVPAMWQLARGPLRWENDSQGLRCGCVSY